MTTAENFRRRQRLEGAFLLFLAIASLVYGIINNARQADQDACMSRSFQESARVSTVRAQLVDKSILLNTRMDEVQEQVIKDVAAARTDKDVLAAFARFNRESTQINREEDQLALQLEENPPPKFPSSKCDSP